MTLMRIEPACTLCGSMKVALFLVLEIIEPCTNKNCSTLFWKCEDLRADETVFFLMQTIFLMQTNELKGTSIQARYESCASSWGTMR